QAATELLKLGRAATVALQAGKKHSDPEVVSRCEQLLPRARALDLAFRLDRFRKDPASKFEHDLPLWKEYRERIGADELARKLFAEMVTASGELMEAVTEEPGRLTERVTRPVEELYLNLVGHP